MGDRVRAFAAQVAPPVRSSSGAETDGARRRCPLALDLRKPQHEIRCAHTGEGFAKYTAQANMRFFREGSYALYQTYFSIFGSCNFC